MEIQRVRGQLKQQPSNRQGYTSLYHICGSDKKYELITALWVNNSRTDAEWGQLFRVGRGKEASTL